MLSILRKIVGSMVLLYAGYLLLANVALAARWRMPAGLRHRVAWTICPGIVEARGGVIQGDGWSVALRQATVRFHVAELLRLRRVEATLDAEVREIATGSLRYAGEARIAGAIGRRSGRFVPTAPLSLRTRGGELFVGGRRAASELRIDAEIGAAVPDPNGRGAGALAGEVLLEGRLADPGGWIAAALPTPADSDPACVAAGGAGDLRADVRFERGAVQPPSVITMSALDMGVALWGACAVVDGSARWTVEPGPAGPQAMLRVQLARATLAYTGDRTGVPPAVLQEEATATLRLRSADPAAPWDVASGAIAIPALELPDLRWLDTDLAGGPAVAAVELAREGGDGWDGSVRATLEGAAYPLGGAVLEGDLVADIELRDLDVAARGARVPAGAVHGTGLTLIHGDRAWGGLEARLEITGGALRLGAPWAFEGDVALAWSDMGPLVRVLAQHAPVPVPAWVARAFGGPLSAQAHVVRRSGALDLDVERAQADVQVQGRLRRSASGTDGAFLVARGLLSAGIRIDEGHVEITPFVGLPWLSAQRAALDERAASGDLP